VGGLPELVDDGINGWLVAPGDVPALASRLRGLLANQELRLSMGAAAYCRARDHFSTAKMTESFAGLYYQLLGEPTT
jgi:glycosyltransferase involved in cell wall biosynthesis